MTIIPVFTTGDDRYTVTAADIYELNFLEGDDWLAVTAGTVTAWMGDGVDFARLNGGAGTVYGQDGADRFDLYAGTWLANGGADNDLFRVFGGNGHDLIGASGNDRFYFYSDSSGVRLSGGDGSDLFVGRGNAISGAIYGGEGNDRFVGFDHPIGEVLVLRGGTGNDVYRLESNLTVHVDERLGEGTDTVLIAGGLDYVLGANVENLIAMSTVGSNAPAILIGNELSNRIQGSVGIDTIEAGSGNDILDGGEGNDVIRGDAGNDRIIGGLGIDTMAGQAGADRYVFRSTAEAPYDPGLFNPDWIYQFDSIDRIDVSAIDADATTDGFQHFHVGAGQGSDVGTLYFYKDPGGWGWTLVEGYTDDDGVPDFFLLITDNYGETYAPVTVDSFIV